VDGLCLKLHSCTPGLVRTSAESTPYKGATSPILLLLLLLLLSLLLLPSPIPYETEQLEADR